MGEMETGMKQTLILGYGNPDREDDGVAWHILIGLAKRLGRSIPSDSSEGFMESGLNPEIVFALQLTPEMAEIMAEYDRICLIDAHTGAVPEELNIQKVDPHFQTSPFTHHLTAQSLLSMIASLYHKEPETVLISVRGYAFGFSNSLSERTGQLAVEAEAAVWKWINQG
jgi:hydrogenase maturation protease